MGYLVKQTSADNVCLAIREIHEGNTFFSPSIPRHLRKRNGKQKMALAGLPKPRMAFLKRL
jgi:DNA-binding NarL/FixJ family response regulator